MEAISTALLTLLVALASAAAVLRLGVLLFMAVGHFRYAQWTRFKGLKMPLRGLSLLMWFWRESSAISVILMHRVLAMLGAGRGLERAEGRPVVLIHGFTQHGSNWLRLRSRLRARGRPSFAPNLGMPFASGLARYMGPVEQALELAAAANSEPVDVVAHSMGGIVLRKVLAQRPDLASRLGTVVSLASPHNGTAAARGFRRVPEARVLARASEGLQKLPTLTELAPGARVVTVAALLDHLVYPVSSCHHGGAEAITLPRPGHVGLLVDPPTVDQVLSLLTSEGVAEAASNR